MSLVSYAQNFEDVLLHRVFGGQETGFYVDVGAYHPVNGSVTKIFYDRGWNGINIEPGSIFAELAAARPNDVNLQMAVLDHAGEVAFIEEDSDRGTSRVSTGEDRRGAARMVPCDTLEAIVREHARGRPVDFVKIDAEGAEAAIIRSTDWRGLRPKVLLIEATLLWSTILANQEWEPTLLEQGYVRAYFDGINCFYVPEEEAPTLLRHFQAPVNVLDRATRYDPAAEAAFAAVARERDRLQAENAALAKEHEALSAMHQRLQDDIRRLDAEHRAAMEACDTAIGERDALAGERDALIAERDALAAALRAAEAPPPDPASEVVSDAARAWPRRSFAHRASRAVARTAYRLVRPVVRPIAWRVRGFMVTSLSEQIRTLDERIALISAAPALTPQLLKNNGAATEMRHLAEEMERALLTLAMERVPDPWSAPAAAGPRPELAAASPRVSLRLPGGRVVEVESGASDLSVSASLKASGGDWEPHVRSYLESVVQSNWVCLDIGANLGAHTLSLAALAREGEVVAFEADKANFELLSRNAGVLAPPHAAINSVHLALWDSRGTLISGGADELAGCSFVAEDTADAALVERRLRAVVDADAIRDTKLHMRLREVPALPLDAWVDENPLPRLDLIKLDVEGAEARVIRGADATLRRYRPLLLVEYNPTCAGTYFGQSADALFHELDSRFATINALEPDGTLTPLADWAALQTRLTAGKGWEDLVCLPGPPA